MTISRNKKKKKVIKQNPSRKVRAKQFFKIIEDMQKLQAIKDKQLRRADEFSDTNELLTFSPMTAFSLKGVLNNYYDLLKLNLRGDIVNYMAHMMRFYTLQLFMTYWRHSIATYISVAMAKDWNSPENIKFHDLKMDSVSFMAMNTDLPDVPGQIPTLTSVFDKFLIIIHSKEMASKPRAKELQDKIWGMVEEIYPNVFGVGGVISNKDFKFSEEKKLILRVISELSWYIDNFEDPETNNDSFAMKIYGDLYNDTINISFYDLQSKIKHAVAMQEIYGNEWNKLIFSKQTPNYIVKRIIQLDDNVQKRLLSGEDSDIRYMARGSRGEPLYPLMKDRWDWCETIIEYKNGMIWEFVNSASSQLEGAAGGHCGNSPHANSGYMRIFSLRQKHPKKELWKLNMTVVIEYSDFWDDSRPLSNEFKTNEVVYRIEMYESKGYVNSRPDNYYKEYVDLLLWLDKNFVQLYNNHIINSRGWRDSERQIKAAKVYGIDGDKGYKPENNARPENFPESLKSVIVNKLPYAISIQTFYEFFYPDLLETAKSRNMNLTSYIHNLSRLSGERGQKRIVDAMLAWNDRLLKLKDYHRIDLFPYTREFGLLKTEKLINSIEDFPKEIWIILLSNVDPFSMSASNIVHNAPEFKALFDNGFFNRNLKYLRPKMLAYMIDNGTPYRKAISALYFRSADANKKQSHKLYMKREWELERENTTYDEKGNVIRRSNDWETTKKTIERKRKGFEKRIKEEARNEISQMFEYVESFNEKQWLAIIEEFPFLVSAGFVVKKLSFENGLKLMQEKFDIKLPETAKTPEGHLYFRLDTNADTLGDLMNKLDNGLERYSDAIEEHDVSSFYEGEDALPHELIYFFQFVLMPFLKEKKPVFYKEHSSFLKRYMEALPKREPYGKGVTEGTVWAEKEGIELLKVLRWAHSDASRDAMADELYKEVINQIQDYGWIENYYPEKGETIILNVNYKNFMFGIQDWFSELEEFDRYYRDFFDFWVKYSNAREVKKFSFDRSYATVDYENMSEIFIGNFEDSDLISR